MILKALTKRRSGFVLGPINVEIGSGITALVGPNGAGKTTLLNVLTGVEPASSGSVNWDAASGPRAGYLPQEVAFPPRARCDSYLDYVAWLWRQPTSEVDRVLEAVGLRDRRHSRIASLSGGMKRRLGIAQALIGAPELLVLDEPTVGLDPARRLSVRETIKQVSRDSACVVSTHLVEDVAALADTVVVLGGGQVQFAGSVAELEGRATEDGAGGTPLERALADLMGELE